MLLLSRRQGESVFLVLPDGTEIEVVTWQIAPDRVRLGFRAPPEVSIYRQEFVRYRPAGEVAP